MASVIPMPQASLLAGAARSRKGNTASVRTADRAEEPEGGGEGGSKVRERVYQAHDAIRAMASAAAATPAIRLLDCGPAAALRVGTVSTETAARPDSVSRFNRCKSARRSVALS